MSPSQILSLLTASVVTVLKLGALDGVNPCELDSMMLDLITLRVANSKVEQTRNDDL